MQRPSERFTDKADVTALLGAFCFFLSAIEYMLPKPLPFMRLGIANLPILLAVDILPFPWFLVLAAVKVIGMSLISGTLFSYVALFSLAGTMAAALAMWALRHAGGRLISQIGVSIAGAMVSNALQVLIARYLVFQEAAWLIAPLFLGMGLVTGCALGLFAEHFARVSTWYARAAGLPDPCPSASAETDTGAGARGRKNAAADRLRAFNETRKTRKAEREAERRSKRETSAGARARRREKAEALFSPGSLALTGLVIMLAFLYQSDLAIKAVMLCAFAAATWMMGKRFSLVTTITVASGIILANLLVPSGRLLGSVLGLRITQGALLEGVEKAVTFEGLMLLSKASIMPGLKLPGRIGRIVAAAFTYYDRIVEYKGKIRPASLALDADALMLRVWESSDRATPAETATKARESATAQPLAPVTHVERQKGIAILSLAALLAWALAVFIG